MSRPTWTEAMDATLREMWAAGHSLTEIGKALGKSKGAIAGRAHRLGLETRPTPIRPKAPGERKARPRRMKRAAETVKLARAPVSFFRTCQFIECEPSADDSCKCGAPTMPGSAYCQAHFERCYIPPPQKEAAE